MQQEAQRKEDPMEALARHMGELIASTTQQLNSDYTAAQSHPIFRQCVAVIKVLIYDGVPATDDDVREATMFRVLMQSWMSACADRAKDIAREDKERRFYAIENMKKVVPKVVFGRCEECASRKLRQQQVADMIKQMSGL